VHGGGSERLLTVAASHPSRQLAVLHHINLTKKYSNHSYLKSDISNSWEMIKRWEKNFNLSLYFGGFVVMSKMLWEPWSICLIRPIVYSEFYHRYLISDDWPARDIDAASMSWDKTRVISRARSSFFLSPFSLLIMHDIYSDLLWHPNPIKSDNNAGTGRRLVSRFIIMCSLSSIPFPIRALTIGAERDQQQQQMDRPGHGRFWSE
jgi:hypothetical protein